MYAVGDAQSHMSPVENGSVPCMHCGKLTGTHPQVGIGEERWFCTIFILGNVRSHMCPVSYGEDLRICPMYAMWDTQ